MRRLSSSNCILSLNPAVVQRACKSRSQSSSSLAVHNAFDNSAAGPKAIPRETIEARLFAFFE